MSVPTRPNQRLSEAAEATLIAARQAMADARQSQHQPMVPLTDEGNPFVPSTAPAPKRVETAELPSAAADISGNDAIGVAGYMSIPDLYDTIREAARNLESAMAGYQAVHAIVTALSSIDGPKLLPPLFNWTARIEDRAVQVVSDLSFLPPAQQLQSLQPWVELHQLQMESAVEKLMDAGERSREILHHARSQDALRAG